MGRFGRLSDGFVIPTRCSTTARSNSSAAMKGDRMAESEADAGNAGKVQKLRTDIVTEFIDEAIYVTAENAYWQRWRELEDRDGCNAYNLAALRFAVKTAVLHSRSDIEYLLAKLDAADRMAEVLTEMRLKYDTIDNGTCAMCRIGHRVMESKNVVGVCGWGDCLSHKIAEAFAAFRSATAKESP